MVGLDASARRKNFRQVRAHLPRNDNGALSADLRPGLFREFAVGASPDRREQRIPLRAWLSAESRTERPSTDAPLPFGLSSAALTAVRTRTPWRANSSWTKPPSTGSTVGSTVSARRGSVTSRPRWLESVSHLKAHVARTPTRTAVRGFRIGQVSMDRETVIHRMQQKHTLVFAAWQIGPSPAKKAGRDDQAIIAHRHLPPGVGTDEMVLSEASDSLNQFNASQYVQTWKLGAMSESMPVGRFAAKKIRQTAYAEVKDNRPQQNRDFSIPSSSSGRRPRRFIPASLPPMTTKCMTSSESDVLRSTSKVAGVRRFFVFVVLAARIRGRGGGKKKTTNDRAFDFARTRSYALGFRMSPGRP